MLIENEFTVSASPARLWEFLNDVERVAPCMPGAELTEVVDARTWKGKVSVKFGPVAMSFSGTVTVQDRDDQAHRVTMHARGMEQKGKGAANAVVTSCLEPAGEGTTVVKMTADVTLTGAAAQLSRGLLPEISKQLTRQFAECLHAKIDAEAGAGAGAEAGAEAGAGAGAQPGTATSAAAPVGGLRLGLKAMWAVVTGWFKRVFGRGAP